MKPSSPSEQDAELYVESVLNAGPPTPSNGWIPLPGATYTLPIGKTGENEIRQLTKMFMWSIALATTEAFAGTSEQQQFVMLLRFRKDDTGVTFSLSTPYPKIVQSLFDLLPPQTPLTAYGARIESSELELRHQYILAEGCRAPVVVVYDPKRAHFLLTNANNVNSPAQFLSPHRCRTTSGFLNFIGTLLLHDIRRDGGGDRLMHFNQHEVINQGLDAWFRWLYHLMETSEVFSPERVFVRADQPEVYDFQYGP